MLIHEYTRIQLSNRIQLFQSARNNLAIYKNGNNNNNSLPELEHKQHESAIILLRMFDVLYTPKYDDCVDDCETLLKVMTKHCRGNDLE